MTHHAFDELSFDVPDGFTFVGVVRLRGEKGDAFAPNMVVTRDRTRPDESLHTYADRQLVELARNLRRFVIRERRDVTVGGVTAREIVCTWQGSQGPVDQRLTIVPRGSSVLTFTATAPKNQSEAVFARFRAVLDTAVFDDTRAPSAAQDPATGEPAT